MRSSRKFPDHIDPKVAQNAQRVIDALRLYHRYQVKGMENIPAHGKLLMVVHHTLATYDIFMLALSVFETTGRATRGLADRTVFKTPFLSDWASKLGAVVGEQHQAHSLLDAGNLVMVAPGGMREALRPSTQRYTTSWQRRYGFAKLALETQTPVICAACPAADDLYTVYANPLTDWVYRNLRLPLPIALGWGGTALPRPKTLTHFIGAPITPPPFDGSQTQVEAFQKILERAMQSLLDLRSTCPD